MTISELEKQHLLDTCWDAIIVGGGMVGAAAALGLARLNLKVLLLELKKPDLNWQQTHPYSVRVSALTRSSENILKNLNAWKGVEKRRCHPFTSMQVWEASREEKFIFDADEIFEENLGYTVENDVIQAALWDEIEVSPNITALFGHKVSALNLPDTEEQFDQLAEVTLDQAGVLQTALVVAADGANSRMRQLANIGISQMDYEQCAVVGCVKTEHSHQNACWQRYNEQGPFAFLAMANGYSSIAWYMPLEKMHWALTLNDDDYAAEIEKASGGQLGEIVQVTERSAFPLIRRHAKHYVKPRFALIGDAAHTINPQAGQGVNIGLLDAAALVDTVSDALQREQKIGLFPQLRHYERWRRGDNFLVQRSMEFFNWFYEQDAPVKTTVRHSLLPVAEKTGLIRPFKHWLMQQVLNGRNELPALARRLN